MTERQASKAPLHDPGMANLASFGIVLVVLGHSAPNLLVDSATSVVLFRGLLGVISLFHMPLFFFISGYLLAHSQSNREGLEGGYSGFVMGKAKRLLIPYWAISTVAFPFKAWMGGQAVRPLTFSVHDYLTSLWIPWQNAIIFFWFLPTLFLLFLVAPLLLTALASRSRLVPIVITVILVLPGLMLTPNFWDDPLNYRGAAAHIPTFWLGMLWRARGPTLSGRGCAWLGGCSAAVFALLDVALYARVLPDHVPVVLASIHLAQAWTGVAASYGIIRWITDLGLRRVPWIHGRSYQIYLLSWFPQIFVKIALFRWMGIGFWPAVLLMFAGGLTVPVLAARLVERRFPKLKPLIGMSP